MRAAGVYQGYISRSPDKRGTRVIRGGCLRLLFPDDVAAQLIRATSELDAETVGYKLTAETQTNVTSDNLLIAVTVVSHNR